MSISLLPTFDTDGYQVEPSTDKLNEVIAAINESGGGGGGDTYPMNPGIWYDNRTAMAGKDGDDVLMEPDTVYGGLIRITDPDANLTAVALAPVFLAPPATTTTVRLSLNAVSETGASRGLPGENIADLGTIVIPDDWDGSSLPTATPNVAVSPGYYWICISATTNDLSVFGFQAYSHYLGMVNGAVGETTVCSGITVASPGAHTSMPATLVGVVTPADRVEIAPLIFFQVTPT